MSSPSLSTPTPTHPHLNDMHPSPPGGPNAFPHGQASAPPRQPRATIPITPYQGSSIPAGQASQSGEFHPSSHTSSYPNYSPNNAQAYGHGTSAQSHILPPFSSISTMGPPTQQGNISSLRYQAAENSRPLPRNTPSGSKRQAPSSSNVTSADSSDLDEEDNGELPASGLVAPWEVLRGLADVAIERAAKVGLHTVVSRRECLTFEIRKMAMAVNLTVEHARPPLTDNLDPRNEGKYATSFLAA